MKMLERLREHAAAHPLRTALSGPDWQFSYGQLVSEVEQAIRQLCEVGTQVLAISMDNGPAWVILDIAALQLDICVVPGWKVLPLRWRRFRFRCKYRPDAFGHVRIRLHDLAQPVGLQIDAAAEVPGQRGERTVVAAVGIRFGNGLQQLIEHLLQVAELGE